MARDTLHIRVQPEDKTQWEICAKRERLTLSAWVIRLCQQAVALSEDPPGPPPAKQHTSNTAKTEMTAKQHTSNTKRSTKPVASETPRVDTDNTTPGDTTTGTARRYDPFLDAPPPPRPVETPGVNPKQQAINDAIFGVTPGRRAR